MILRQDPQELSELAEGMAYTLPALSDRVSGLVLHHELAWST